MKKKLNCLAIATAVLTMSCITCADAQTEETTKLPAAIEVLKKFADASGGANKFKEIKTLRMVGKLTIADQGVEGAIDVQVEVPNKLLSVVTIPNVLTESQGSNGDVVWSNNSMMGPRIVDGQEKEAILEEANFEKFYKPEKFFSEMSVAGIAEVDGEKCYQLELTKKNGLKATEYYSIKTGLNVKSSSIFPHQMGDLKIENKPSDYRDTGGVKFPHRIEMIQQGGPVIVIKFDSIKVNAKLADATFAIPAEVKGLIPDKKDSEK